MDLQQLEKAEIDLMIERGVEFTIDRKSIFRFLTKSKVRTFEIKQPYLGTLMLLSAEFAKIDYSEEKLKSDGLSEVKRLAVSSCKPLSNILAIAVLGSKWKIWLFRWFLSEYFLWRVKPTKMLELSLIVNYMMNQEGFITSIRLNAIHKIASPPELIEEELIQED